MAARDAGRRAPTPDREQAPAGPSLVDAVVDVVQSLSIATDMATVQAIVLHAVRRITGADGITFVVRDGDHCFYVDEEAIAPLWKGRRFPSSICISGWVMHHGRAAVIPDITTDERIPQDVYRATFVRSLAMVPIRAVDPLGAIGAYWEQPHAASSADIRAVRTIADATAVAMERLRSDQALARRLDELDQANRALEEANEQLREAAERLARSDEIRVAFLRATSHELRTPLTSIVGFAELVHSRDADLDDEDRHLLLGRLMANASRLGRLVDDLLDVDRLTSGLITANLEPHDLEQLVRRVVAEQELSNHHLELELEPVVAEVDPPKLERVVANLVANAVRHTAPGGTIRVRLHSAESGTVLTVEDNGEGIDASYLEHIFEPFVQGPAQQQAPQPGTGLGLTLASELVALHHGSLTASNLPDGGARFEVRLADDRGEAARGSRGSRLDGAPHPNRG